jgi:hypothetical protein
MVAAETLPTARHAHVRSQDATPLAKVGYFTVAILWVLVLLEPQTWLAEYGPEVLHKLPTILFGILTVELLVSPPRARFYTPLLAVVLVTAATAPFAYNIGYAIEPLKKLVVIYLLALGTLRFVRTAKQVTFVLILGMLAQYLWYGLLGVRSGSVWWHSMLANEDAFGPLMVVGSHPSDPNIPSIRFTQELWRHARAMHSVCTRISDDIIADAALSYGFRFPPDRAVHD